MKKLLSSLLVLALALGYCAPCLAAGNETTQTKTAQEKEIEKIKEDLRKHNKEKLEEIDKLKWMSDNSYSEYKFEQYINKFFGILAYVLTGAGTLALTFSYGKKSGEECVEKEKTRSYNAGEENAQKNAKGYLKYLLNRDRLALRKEGFKKGLNQGRKNVFNQIYNFYRNKTVIKFVNLLNDPEIKAFFNFIIEESRQDGPSQVRKKAFDKRHSFHRNKKISKFSKLLDDPEVKKLFKFLVNGGHLCKNVYLHNGEYIYDGLVEVNKPEIRANDASPLYYNNDISSSCYKE